MCLPPETRLVALADQSSLPAAPDAPAAPDPHLVFAVAALDAVSTVVVEECHFETPPRFEPGGGDFGGGGSSGDY